MRALSSGSEPYAAAFPQICELEGLDNDIADPPLFTGIISYIFILSVLLFFFFSLFFSFFFPRYYRDEQFFGTRR